jgi:hypothetical protein
MGPLYEHFKFAVGDFVQHVVASNRESRKMQIIERWYQECPGGVQLHYTCHAYQCNTVKFIEIELEPYAETKDEENMSSWMSDRSIRRAARAAEEKKTSGDDSESTK